MSKKPLDILSKNFLDSSSKKSLDMTALAGLSERETEIAILVAQSLTNQEIARAMLLSTATVKTHLTKIFDELGINNRVQLALLVREAELI